VIDSMSFTPSARRLLIMLLLIALTLAFFWKLAFTDLMLARGDTFFYFYPLWTARDAALSQGQLPLWAPSPFMGIPLLSDPQSGTFYPPNWLTLGLAPPDAVRISILLHITWAGIGAFALTRRVMKLPRIPALIAAVIFVFGGYVGAHVEQINQLQGIVWLPWALLCLDASRHRPRLFVPLLAMIFALQLFSGHTQTVFMTGVALGIYGLIAPLTDSEPRSRDNILRRIMLVLIGLGIAVVLAVILALPQLYPTLELTSLSNRTGGFNPQETLAFSWNPLLVGRGMLPSYDAQVFGEYVAYIGVIGLVLAVIGMLTPDRRRWVCLALVVVGGLLALGYYNPLNWTLARLPGFNLFRVPARWLALVTLGLAMLAGLGTERLLTADFTRRQLLIRLAAILLILGPLMVSSMLSSRVTDEIDGSAVPTITTWLLWIVALALSCGLLVLSGWRRRLPPIVIRVVIRALPAITVIAVMVELWLASTAMPYNDLVDPQVYHDARMSVYQLQALDTDDPASDSFGRMLSISTLFFDPGDKAVLESRWRSLNMTERASRTAFTATKAKEVIAPNLPLMWGVPSIDGYGGGLLPTTYYTQFTALLLPDGMPPTVDGRLRELLAQSACNGACIPDKRWLNLTNIRYLLLDKTFDLWQDDIAYDSAFTLAPGETVTPYTDLTGTALRLLIEGAGEDSQPSLTLDGETLEVEAIGNVGNFALWRAELPEPQSVQNVEITFDAEDDQVRLRALTIVDEHTGAFMQIPLDGWRLLLSSDIKLYENLDVLPRAFLVSDVQIVSTDVDGTEVALDLMRDPTFDPSQNVILAADTPIDFSSDDESTTGSATIVSATNTMLEIAVDAEQAGFLVMTDAWYPGWTAQVNGQPTDLYRANAMFRAVAVPEGQSSVTLTYAPDWLSWILPVGVFAWGISAIWVLIVVVRNRSRTS
jgi:hypothetical protein